MPPKHKSDASAGGMVKKRKTITMEKKVEIIKRSERGETPSSIGRAFAYSRSTIATILKDKGRIMEHVKGHTPMNATIITKQRSGLIIEMERLLIIWIQDQNQRNMPVSLPLVQEKARSLFNDLKAARTACEGDCKEEFVASRGWFNRFKERANLHNIKARDGAATANVRATSDFPKTWEDIVDKGGYLPDQIFNVDETGSFWKKMPEKTYILKEEESTSGHETSKDRLTLLLGGNAFREENRDLETPESKKFSTKELADAFRLIEAGMAKLEEQDPDRERFAKVYCTVSEGLRCYRAIYDEKKKSSVQTSIDAYLKKLTPAAESDPHSLIPVPSSPTNSSSSASVKIVEGCI
ncbi:PRKR-interacting protein 1 isoform X2 [Nycticebus coucang]|nr:PRKR-interacting protein 1 isoform X2 [Nycticebus coucang]XP_053413463.1 PRKR-interacting protein 1 isoform X2 [Nycticebus coucang]